MKNGMTLKPIRNDDLAACVILGKTEIRGPFDKLPRFALFWDKDVRLARQMEKLGVKLFNSSRAIAICDDKNMTHQMLSDQGLPMPDTIFAPLVYSGCDCDEAYFVERIESILSYPMIVKEAYGSFGAQVYMAQNRDELLALRKRLAAKPHLYQEYIRTSHGRDVRIQVVGDQVAAAMLRTSDSDFRANITAGGKMHPFYPPKAFSDLAIRASRLLGLDFAGVDILFGENDEPILCEINSNAHMKNLLDCTGVDVADLIIKHIRQRMMAH
jgi:RimK family alpha-L-glutamate ligase